jgi:hypothetical protein
VASRAFLLAIQRHGNVAKRAVIHVHRARPADSIGIEIQFIAVEEMGVNQRGEQILRGGNRMKIAMEMKVDLFAGLDLRESAPSGATFGPEKGTEGGLPGGNDRSLPESREALSKSDCCDGFALAGNRWRRRRNENEFSAPRE